MRRLDVIALLIGWTLASGGYAQPERGLAEIPILSDRPLRRPPAEPPGLAPMVDTARQRLSTWPVGTGDASYAMARFFLDGGGLPPAATVWIEDFVGAFAYGEETARGADTPWRAGGGLRLAAEVFPSPSRRGYHVLHVSLHGGVAVEDRDGANVVVVIEISGKPEHTTVREALSSLMDALIGRDRIGILAYGPRGRVALEPTSISHRFELEKAFGNLRPGRAGDLEESLLRAYEMATRHLEPHRTHHVVLCTDGDSGEAAAAQGLLGLVRRQAQQGISLTVVSFGAAADQALLAQMASHGDGRFAFVDHPSAVRHLFAEKLPGDLTIVARDVRSQIELDPRAVSRYRLLGRAPRAGHFADDRGGGELAAGEHAAALYEVRLRPATSSALGIVRVRYRTPEGFPGRFEQPLARSMVVDSVANASPPAKLAWIAAAFAEKLAGSYWTRSLPYWQLLRSLDSLAPGLGTDPRTAELRYLVRRAAQIDHRAALGSEEALPQAGFEHLRILE